MKKLLLSLVLLSSSLGLIAEGHYPCDDLGIEHGRSCVLDLELHGAMAEVQGTCKEKGCCVEGFSQNEMETCNSNAYRSDFTATGTRKFYARRKPKSRPISEERAEEMRLELEAMTRAYLSESE